jgi:hypothetical protein
VRAQGSPRNDNALAPYASADALLGSWARVLSVVSSMYLAVRSAASRSPIAM